MTPSCLKGMAISPAKYLRLWLTGCILVPPEFAVIDTRISVDFSWYNHSFDWLVPAWPAPCP
ncbi:hypothetical protein SANTM175S_02202 [Streptomyces antimycoticus]